MKKLDKKLKDFFEYSFSSYRRLALLLLVVTFALSLPLTYSLLSNKGSQTDIPISSVAEDTPLASSADFGCITCLDGAQYCGNDPKVSDCSSYCTTDQQCRDKDRNICTDDVCVLNVCRSTTIQSMVGRSCNTSTNSFCNSSGDCVPQSGGGGTTCSSISGYNPNSMGCLGYPGNDLAGSGTTRSVTQCQQDCQNNSSCAAWTWVKVSSSSGRCYLKNPKPTTTDHVNDGTRVSGSKPGGATGGNNNQNGGSGGNNQTGGGGGTGENTNTVPTNLSAQPDISGECADTNYTVQLSWSGASGQGWYINISEDQNFSGWSQKALQSNVTSTPAPSGFNLGLGLQPDRTYYWRVYNGQTHSQTDSFSVPSCQADNGDNNNDTGNNTGNQQPPTSQTYTLTTSLDKSNLAAGESAQYCYKLTPENVSFNARVSAAPQGGTYAQLNSWTDNGTGGGDCIPFNVPANATNGQYNLKTEALINSAVVAEHIIPYTVGAGGSINPPGNNDPNQTGDTNNPPATPSGTLLTVSVNIPGVGANATIGQNTDPVKKNLAVEVGIFDITGSQVKDTTGTLNFAADSSSFTGDIDLGDISNDAYTIKIRTENSLWEAVTTQIAASASNVINAELITGDIDQNNILNLLDYNAIITCYNQASCPDREKTDLNLDNRIDELDLNILYSGFASRQGD